MRLNDIGQIVMACWLDLPAHYNHVLLDAFVVMPNHIHAVIGLRGYDDNIVVNTFENTVGAGLRPAPTTPTHAPDTDEALLVLPSLNNENTVGAGFRPAPTTTNDADEPDDAVSLDNAVDIAVGAGLREAPLGGRPAPTTTNDDSPKRHALPEIVRALKSFSSRRINGARNRPGVRRWQRGYYEHVVRSEPDLARIRIYIQDNPARWTFDEYYTPDKMGR